jgi:hypothetical protein
MNQTSSPTRAHRGHPFPEPDDSFSDRRLSDVLPTEIVRQIGLDPDALVFETRKPREIHRRNTDPGLSTVHPHRPHQRRSNTIERVNVRGAAPSPLLSIPPPKITGWYNVAINDTQVRAYATIQLPGKPNDGVLVRENGYTRFGRIVEAIQVSSDTDRNFPQIISLDRDYLIADHVRGQSELAQRMVSLFLKEVNCPAVLIGIESISFRSRGLLRLAVSDPEAPGIEEAVSLTIQMFAVAVEVVGPR